MDVDTEDLRQDFGDQALAALNSGEYRTLCDLMLGQLDRMMGANERAGPLTPPQPTKKAAQAKKRPKATKQNGLGGKPSVKQENALDLLLQDSESNHGDEEQPEQLQTEEEVSLSTQGQFLGSLEASALKIQCAARQQQARQKVNHVRAEKKPVTVECKEALTGTVEPAAPKEEVAAALEASVLKIQCAARQQQARQKVDRVRGEKQQVVVADNAIAGDLESPSRPGTVMSYTSEHFEDDLEEHENELNAKMTKHTHVLGVIGGSSLFHAKSFSSNLVEQVVATDFGGVVCHVGSWQPRSEDGVTESAKLQIVFVQRHHAAPNGVYNQPREINFRAIVKALQTLNCEAVIGIYSVGSMTRNIDVGRFVVPEDFFSPFDIMHLSKDYDAHVVPELDAKLRATLIQALDSGDFEPHDGGVYVQTAGPRFETKSEVRFFAQFGQLIGMTGANEAELLNELRVPFAMFAIVDNLANGIGESLTLEAFKATQKANAHQMERAVCQVLDEIARTKVLATVSTSL
ncbi:hypothetical protein BBO99_00004524 [Phytophthora kernoviae]|uniref:Nucleoside phosphorylase domain-containing protein n=2 Tax=Phytophthora kernoviae TaxID=325452 RepID=A0A3R7JZV9_9STRA|nr:hypothetical protein G195_004955 [Phytophthora kernoviae 00238/432]KAG2521828.1 hypothetical protein JM16_004305 [Phytophthora kernoviae]RLN15168.1 hypothetical protein BBI17_004716 [Phytophthora kernoviae]RLN80407.1 hypothetical protein BBO99_00004524 [Phytophthora kernoviae]